MVNRSNRYKSTRDGYLQRSHGLSEAEVDAEAQYQQDLCAVCGETQPIRWDGSQRPLVVDHDHGGISAITGREFRALLCDRCNKVLGACRDSVPLFLKLAAYLCRHRGLDFSEQVNAFE